MTKRKAAVFLWFDTEAESAAEFYVATFPDTRVDTVIRVPEGAPTGPAGAVQVVAMTLLGLPYALLNAGPHVQPNDAYSLQVSSALFPGQPKCSTAQWTKPRLKALVLVRPIDPCF